MAETPENGDEQKVPPKLTIRPRGDDSDGQKQAPTGSSAETPRTPPKTVSMKPPAGLPPLPPNGKKKTTRISLEDALGTATAGSAPKTVRLTPADGPGQPAPTASAPRVIGPPPRPGEENLSEAEVTAAKRKTSRISLDAVLGPAMESEGPKTIRLKRPSEAATVRMGQSVPGTGDAGGVPPKKATAPVTPPAPELTTAEESEEEDVPSTRRKTIRVKRPTAGVRVKTGPGPETVEAEVEGGTEDAVARTEAFISRPFAIEDRPHWFFLLSEIAAVLVACVTIYVMSAQAFGPDASLTRLSYGASDMYLSWPGRVMPTR